jgi:hypothetical protein
LPDQREHDKPKNLVEDSQELEREAARSLNDAVDSHETLQGYYAMNNERPSKELEEEAEREGASRKRAVGTVDQTRIEVTAGKYCVLQD